MSSGQQGNRGARITLERFYDADVEDVWALWTTKEGIESWWGPDGFMVEVHHIDLRPGGLLLYAMKAVGAPQIAFMERAGMPLTTEARITFTEVTPLRHLAYVHLADFVPGVTPYDVATTVDLVPERNGVRLQLAFDPMHDETWTRRAVMGWENELEKLRVSLDTRKQHPIRSASMPSITPFLWFDHQAEEAVNFYTTVFPDSSIGAVARYGDSGPGPAGSVMTISFRLQGQDFVALNGGPHFKFTEAISFVVRCRTQEEIDRYWEQLSAGGAESRCGWLKDRYGLSWQIIPEGLERVMKSPKAVAALMTMRKLDWARLQEAAKG